MQMIINIVLCLLSLASLLGGAQHAFAQSTIPQSGWSLHYVDSEELVGENGAAVNAFDGNPGTIWHTQWFNVTPKPSHPHDLQVDLGALYSVEGIRYLPRPTGSNGRIGQYEVYVATDSSTPPTTPPVLGEWTLVQSGTFPNSGVEQEVTFGAISSRYVWLRALSEANSGGPWTTVAEFNVLGTLSGTGVVITPTTATVPAGGQQVFAGSGGTPGPSGNYAFILTNDTSGGASIGFTTGLYTAGPNAGTSTIRMADSSVPELSTQATVTVTGGGSTLGITPGVASLAVGGQQAFVGSNGVPPYSFSLQTDTTGGATVDGATGLYTAGPAAGTSTVRVTDNNAATADAMVTVTGGGGTPGLINQSGWSLHYVDSEELVGENGAAVNAFDGNPGTIWHTQWFNVTPKPSHPHDLQVDLGALYSVEGIRYLPRPTGSNGRIGQYEVYVATDSSTPPTTPPVLGEWTLVQSGTFPNSGVEQEVTFGAISSRYVWLRALSETNSGGPWTTVAEFNVLGTLSGTGVVITPTTATVPAGGQQVFAGSGGTPGPSGNYAFILTNDTSGGASIGFTTGLYTAGPNAGTSTIRMADSSVPELSTQATVTVTGGGSTLGITPGAASLAVGGQQAFVGSNGVPPYSFSLQTDTTGGATVDGATGLYTAGPAAGTSTVRVTDNNAATADAMVTVTGGGGTPGLINQSGWSLHYVDSEELVGENGAAVNAFDGNPGTIWHTQWFNVTPKPSHPHDLQVDLGALYSVEGIRYLPRPTGSNGRIGQYEVYVATDSSTPPTTPPVLGEWTLVQSGTFPNSGVEQEVTFGAISSRYVWLRALSETNSGGPWTTVAEFNVLGTLSGTGVVITPTTATVPAGGQQVFAGSGGTPGPSGNYAFILTNDTSGGASIGFTTGLYTAGPNAGTSTIRMADSSVPELSTQATVTVTGGGSTLGITPGAASLAVGGQQAFVGSNGVPPYSFSLQTDTTGGATVDGATGLYTAGPAAGTSTVRVTDNNAATADAMVTVTGGGGTPGLINQSGWSLHYVDSEELVGENGAAVNAFDGNPGTIWHTQWFNVTPKPSHPHDLQVDLGALYSVEGIRYLPRPTGSNGRIGQYEVYVATDSSTPPTTPPVLGEWTLVQSGTFPNSGVEQEVTFGAISSRYVWLRALSEASSGGPWTTVAEFNVLGTLSGTGVVITPTTATVPAGGQQVFAGSGGTPGPLGNYAFILTNDTSGGASIGFTTGLYTAGPNAGTSTIRMADSSVPELSTQATVTVTGGGSTLGITPGAVSLAVGGQQAFVGSNGVPPYSFSLQTDTTGGATVDGATGLYTAGPAAGTSTVRMTDASLSAVDAGITVTEGVAVLNQSTWSVHFVNSQTTGNPAINSFDGNANTVWKTVNTVLPPHDLQIDLGAIFEIEGFRLLPESPYQGEGISFYEFFVSEDGVSWGSPVAAGEFLNDVTEKTITFPRVSGRFVRIRPLGEFNNHLFIKLAELNILGAPFSGNHAPEGTINSPSGNLTINAGNSVVFSGTFSDSDGHSPLSYSWDFGDPAILNSTIKDPGSIVFNNPGTYTVTFTVTDSFGRSDPLPGMLTIKVLSGANSVLNRNDWTVRYVNSEEVIKANNAAINAFDGNTSTIWHTQWSDVNGPHEIQINLGSAFAVDAFRYLPRQDNDEGRIDEYHIYVSSDGVTWGAPVAHGSFANNLSEKRIVFPPKTGQFVRLVGNTEVQNRRWATMAEVNIEGECRQPFVRIIDPLTDEVQSRPNLTVRASVCLTQASHAGWGVRISVDSSPQQIIPLPADGVIHPDTFQWTITGLVGDNHQIEAFIVDNFGNQVSGPNAFDSVTNVGLGDVYDAIGDSLTVGIADDDPSDAISLDGRNTNTGIGFIPLLNNLLTAEKGYPHNIHNSGVGGETSAAALIRVPSALKRHQKATIFLLLLGTNDANSGLVPSGKGLIPGDPGYPGTYKDNLQQIIDLIQNSGNGKAAYLAKVPFTLNSSIIPDIQDYNIVVDELVAANGIPVVPPDLFTHFQSTQIELAPDGLHPNGAGYKSIGSLWCIAVTSGTCPVP